MIDTKSEFLLEDIDFSGDEAHLAYTLGTGAASMKNESYLLKGDDIELDQESQELLETISKGVEKEDLEKATKQVGGESLSASAYAYTPDKEKTSTWKLRIDDANHVRAAVAALGEGFRGNKVEIPSDDLASVKSKVRSAYRKFFPDNETPEVLKSLDTESLELESPKDTTIVDKGDSPQHINNEDNMSDNKQVEELLKAQEAQEAKIAELLKASKVQAELLKSQEEQLKSQEEQLAKASEKELQMVTKSVADEVCAIVGISDDTKNDIAKAMVGLHGTEAYTAIMKGYEEISKAITSVATEEVGVESTDEEVNKSVDNTMAYLEEAMKGSLKAAQ